MNQKPLCHNPDIVPRIYWDSSLSVENLPKVDFCDLEDEEKRFTERKGESVEDTASRRPALKQLLTNILCYGFTFIDNTPPTMDGSRAAIEFVCFPMVSYNYWLLLASCCLYDSTVDINDLILTYLNLGRPMLTLNNDLRLQGLDPQCQGQGLSLQGQEENQQPQVDNALAHSAYPNISCPPMSRSSCLFPPRF